MDRKTAPLLAVTSTFLVVLCLNVSINDSSRIVSATDNRKVGAYYYVWYGLDTSKGYQTNWENKTETPSLGEYNSSDPAVADQHIQLATQHKIDFFAISWLGVTNWFDHLAIDNNLKNGFLKAGNITDFKFCLLYETDIVIDSTYDYCNKTHYNATSPAELFKNNFNDDMNYAAANYFNHSSYLRIAGKPVLFLYDMPYLCQNLSISEAHAMLADLRQRFANNIYLVGDAGHGPNRTNLGFQLSDFMDILDAVTCYSFSSPLRKWSGILEDAEHYYPDWHSYLASQGKQFIPNAYPGYNATKEGINTTLPVNVTGFGDFLQRAWDNIDSNGIVMITSWNEWKESTTIEHSIEFEDQLLDIVPEVVPEFSSTLLLLIVLSATASSVLVYRKKYLSDKETPMKEKSKGVAHAAAHC
jgi:hypothetical protein